MTYLHRFSLVTVSLEASMHGPALLSHPGKSYSRGRRGLKRWREKARRAVRERAGMSRRVEVATGRPNGSQTKRHAAAESRRPRAPRPRERSSDSPAIA